jgi:excisionase family DNA binding protein
MSAQQPDDGNPPEAGITNREVLDFDSAAAFLGVSTKTFAKVLRTEGLPGRKVGREWKFSKQALLNWLACGNTRDYQDDNDEAASTELTPKPDLRAQRPLPRRENRTTTIPGTGGPPQAAADAFSADED